MPLSKVCLSLAENAGHNANTNRSEFVWKLNNRFDTICLIV